VTSILLNLSPSLFLPDAPAFYAKSTHNAPECRSEKPYRRPTSIRSNPPRFHPKSRPSLCAYYPENMKAGQSCPARRCGGQRIETHRLCASQSGLLPIPANCELSPPGFTFPAPMASIPRVHGVPIGAELERWQGGALSIPPLNRRNLNNNIHD